MNQSKVTRIEKSLNSKVTVLEKKVSALEDEVQSQSEKIKTLSTIIIKMQNALNTIDSSTREKNIIISGLTEDVKRYYQWSFQLRSL